MNSNKWMDFIIDDDDKFENKSDYSVNEDNSEILAFLYRTKDLQALTLEHSQPLVMVAIIYLVIVMLLTQFVKKLEQWLSRGRR